MNISHVTWNMWDLHLHLPVKCRHSLSQLRCTVRIMARHVTLGGEGQTP